MQHVVIQMCYGQRSYSPDGVIKTFPAFKMVAANMNIAHAFN